MRIPLEEFNQELVAPAHRRVDELRAEIAEAERELEALIRARAFDDAATDAAQVRLETLNREHRRWERRWHHLEGCLNVRDATGYVALHDEA